MPIPWGLIIEAVFRIVNFFIKDKERRDALRRQMYEFIKEHDASAMGNVKLREDYERLLAEAAKKEEVKPS